MKDLPIAGNSQSSVASTNHSGLAWSFVASALLFGICALGFSFSNAVTLNSSQKVRTQEFLPEVHSEDVDMIVVTDPNLTEMQDLSWSLDVSGFTLSTSTTDGFHQANSGI